MSFIPLASFNITNVSSCGLRMLMHGNSYHDFFKITEVKPNRNRTKTTVLNIIKTETEH